MGACNGTSTDPNARDIEQKMAEQAREDGDIHKLLFLGPGKSGKSTIFRQLQWLHGNGFSKEEAATLKQHIYVQITSQMKCAINKYVLNHRKSYRSIGGIPIDTEPSTSSDDELQNAISIIINHRDPTTFNDTLFSAIQYVWRHEPKLQNIFLGNDGSDDLDESTEYFWNQIDRIKTANYTPTEQDIINVSYRTTGLIDKKFKINGCTFNIFDVGGQKSERKKWIHCFNEVEAVIFVISLSSFNEVMYEDHIKNSMVDALELFDTTINNKYFRETNIILFLNKKDLFKAKITNIPITDCPAFTDFNGNNNDYKETASYIKSKFLSLNQNKAKKKIFTHFTCGIDKENINNVFNDVKRIVMQQNLTKVYGADVGHL